MAATNLNDYYTGLGQNLPSLSSRGGLFEQYGLGSASGYTGTAEQNTSLLKALQLKGAGATNAQTGAMTTNYRNPNADMQTAGLTGVSNLGSTLGVGAVPTPTSALDASKLPAGPSSSLTDMLKAAVSGGDQASRDAGLFALMGASSASDKSLSDLNDKLLAATDTLGGAPADTQSQLDSFGVQDSYKHAQDLTLQAEKLKGQLSAFDAETQQGLANIEGQQIPLGLVQGQQAAFNKQRDLSRLAKSAELSGVIGLAEAYKGNADTALKLIDESVKLKYQPVLDQIATIKTQISIKEGELSREDAKRANIVKVLLDQRQNDIEAQQKNDLQIQTLGAEAAAAGAPLSLVRSAVSTNDIIKASSILSSYVHSTGEKGLNGSTPTSSSPKTFTTTQINKGANGAGLSSDEFKKLDYEVQNFFISSPAANLKAVSDVIASVKSKEATPQEASDWVDASNLSEPVKQYIKSQIPNKFTFGEPAKTGLWDSITSWFKGITGN